MKSLFYNQKSINGIQYIKRYYTLLNQPIPTKVTNIIDNSPPSKNNSTTPLLINKYKCKSQLIFENTDKTQTLESVRCGAPSDRVRAKHRYLIVGLGNPGDKYTNNRHNIGFKAIDNFANQLNTTITQNKNHCLLQIIHAELDDHLSHKEHIDNYRIKQQRHKLLMESQQQQLQVNITQPDNEQIPKIEKPTEFIKPSKVVYEIILMKPQKYMNLSGGSVKGIMTNYNVPSENILILLDDATMDVGLVRMRSKGGSGGQKGMDDIIKRVGGEKVNRIKIGVGIPGSGEILTDFVLKNFNLEEQQKMKPALDRVSRSILLFIEKGSNYAMNLVNK
ncbi:Peptidyl-tRNA hydrolase [Tieghemostelium lacteum]|uniref:peptidyl-tRNA hydrolase n=1 Tax=Tieghemostelium lacteum TaxID=361077 RepID=A0A152A3F7_TIELA|nr:Peptidyl-tRNA hydrolase [Tieghemostelium lacteum]|eukprot:KYR00734.1 Peptidyl-tRNA hydrolase [Tieghemostelium lacteum]